MNLAEEFRDLLHAYLSGARSLADVHLWLVMNAQAVADAGDHALSSPVGRVWILYSEYDADHLDEDAVRSGIAAALNPGIEGAQ